MTGWRALAGAAAALALAVTIAAAAQAAPERVAVFVTSNGWHTGLTVPRGALPPDAVPEAADFPEAPYLEFGWGDAAFYPDPEAGLFAALDAALGGSPAVLHLAGLPARPDRLFPEAEVVRLTLTRAQMHDLAAYLDGSFARGGAARTQSTAPGLYDFSRFYPATGEFSLANTCNTWLARALAAAGLAVDPDGVVRTSDLMAQIRPLAEPALESEDGATPG